MSKWVNKDKFEDFKKERENDNTEKNDSVDYARTYPNPKMGTLSKPKEYHMRLLTDQNGDFYKKYHYHMFQSGENWNFIMCPKTNNMDAYCPWCQATQQLYKGSAADKKAAYKYKRKDKYVGNVFVTKDPRDNDEDDTDKLLAGKTFLYNFPQTIETLIKKEITDTENGWGYDIFDPETGYNLIINIGAKKPDKNGKVWPDYSLTAFAKRPSGIADTDDGITEIMESCQSISEYIENSLWTTEKHQELLKSEMLFEDVEDQFMRHMKFEDSGTSDDDKPSEPSDDKPKPKKDKPSKPKKEESSDELDKSDEELLAELDNL